MRMNCFGEVGHSILVHLASGLLQINRLQLIFWCMSLARKGFRFVLYLLPSVATRSFVAVFTVYPKAFSPRMPGSSTLREMWIAIPEFAVDTACMSIVVG